jgi:Family of unknown function (DUF6498)
LFNRFFKDPGFWFLIAINCYLIYHYRQNPGEFNSIVWIFFLQSVIIGFFNFLNLLTIKNPDEKSLSHDGEPVSKNTVGCMAFFFLVHFGGFHFAYMIFLFVEFTQNVDVSFVLITASIFLAESTIRFIRTRTNPSTEKVHVGKLFVTPYLRIVPMHLMILLPSILGLSASAIFLILKAVADVGMYLLSDNSYKTPQTGV